MNPNARNSRSNGHFRAGIVRYDAAAVCDGTGLVLRPGSLLVEHGSPSAGPACRVLAVGKPEDVQSHPAAAHARVVSLANSVLIPGLVNAHAHLDLTHIGPQPHDPAAGFTTWVDMIRSRRHSDPAEIASSVRRGIELSLAGGIVAIGDIAGAPAGIPSLAPYETLKQSPLRAVSFVEFFGIGTTRTLAQDRVEAAISGLSNSKTVRLGLQPHAPNTVDLRLYEWATQLAEARGLPLATHLAETPEEREFVANARGPQRAFLERLGIWEPSILDFLGRGDHPVRHLREILAKGRFTVAHVNDADDAAIETLARTQTSVAYCPRASSYFDAEHHFGPHRYRDMLKAGINVALGTDSIVNLPAESASPDRGGISTLGEMRLLYRRDHTDPRTLLRMATLNGAAALGVDPSLFRFQPGAELAGLVALQAPTFPPDVHPLIPCLESDSIPTLLQGRD